MSEGLLVAGEPYVERGRSRRDYALTPAGRDALEREAAALAGAAETVAVRLRASGSAASA
jgi:DNA-binding PadR family transcriptional regulator